MTLRARPLILSAKTMSHRAVVEMQCPAGCEPFEAEAWSVLRIDRNPELRDSLLAGEMNLIACRSCGRYFVYEHPLVYHDPPRELLAFIFPEGFKQEADRWRAKMQSDLEDLRRATPAEERLDYDPMLFFGLEAFRTVLEEEMNLDDEVDIMLHLARALKLDVYPVKPSWARARKLPPLLPVLPGAGDPKARLSGGLERLLKENEFLLTYRRALEALASSAATDVPPRGRERAAA